MTGRQKAQAWAVMQDESYEYGGSLTGIVVGTIEQVEDHLKSLAKDSVRDYRYGFTILEPERNGDNETSVHLHLGEVTGTTWTAELMEIKDLRG